VISKKKLMYQIVSSNVKIFKKEKEVQSIVMRDGNTCIPAIAVGERGFL